MSDQSLREQIIEEALLRIKERVCGDRIPRWEGDAATTASRIVIADICDRALSAAPNNAGEPQQGDSAIATSERPDRASSDRGTLDIEDYISIWSMRPQPGTPSGNAWEAGARQGWQWARDALKTASSANGNAVAGESPDARDARWISVSERLPDTDDDVLIWHVLGDQARSPRSFDVAAYMNGKWVLPWDRDKRNPPPEWVTHWKPITPPGDRE